MRENQSISCCIASILTNSGLPMERRAEVAEELRDHLFHMVDEKCAAGMNEEQAVKAALIEFGSLDAIRKQLRKQQGVLDRRQVMDTLRGYLWALVVGCGLFATSVAIFAPSPASVSLRCLVGGCVFVFALVIICTLTYSAELFSYRLQRARPRSEYMFQKSLCYWAAVVFAFLAVTLAMGPLFIGICGYFAQNGYLQSFLDFSPKITEGAHWTFWHNMAIGAVENPLRSFLLPLSAVFVFALLITFYERSWCVDKDEVADTFIAQ